MKALHTIVFASAMAMAALASPIASAHASLNSSNPEAGATVDTAPKHIALTFNEKVEQAFSSISVADAGGKQVSVAKAKVDADNPALLLLDVPTLASGTYTVSWAVAGRDGHRRKGEFRFTVK